MGVEGRRAEVKTLPHGPDIRVRGASAQSVWRSLGRSRRAEKSGAWSLQSVEKFEHRGGDASWECGQTCCAVRSCALVCGTWRESRRELASQRQTV